MISTLSQSEEKATAKAVQAWERRRPAWTRTDTVRWLNDRSALVLAWLRRTDPPAAPSHSASMGRWLKDNRPERFARAHARLLVPAHDQSARDRLTLLEILT